MHFKGDVHYFDNDFLNDLFSLKFGMFTCVSSIYTVAHLIFPIKREKLDFRMFDMETREMNQPGIWSYAYVYIRPYMVSQERGYRSSYTIMEKFMVEVWFLLILFSLMFPFSITWNFQKILRFFGWKLQGVYWMGTLI